MHLLGGFRFCCAEILSLADIRVEIEEFDAVERSAFHDLDVALSLVVCEDQDNIGTILGKHAGSKQQGCQ